MNAPRHNLPTQPTPLIGRDDAVTTAVDLLQRDDVRLLTITGPAGVGKSRLAVAVGSRNVRAFEEGVWFVDLAAIDTPTMVPAQIGWTLGLREARDIPFIDSLRHFLVKRQTLLVLDNFEHLLAAAPLLGELLAACPYLKLLITSRAPLHLRWEHELPLAPLDLPPQAAWADRNRLAKVPAVALFLERARAVEPAITLASENAQIVAKLCQHLDGLPLAIELAAARVRLLSPRAMLTRLSDGAASTSLDLLAAGALDMPPRHQTLRAAIGWSHALLSPDHQALFRRLAVFVGGCTLEMADAVCGNAPSEGAEAAGGSILDSLGVLVENHLLRRETTADGEPRFRMLTTIHEYAAERLAASGEAESMRRRHALAMMQLAQQAERELGGPRETELLDVLEREYDNLRAALGYLTSSDAVDAGLRASRALWRFWSIRGQLSDGRAWLAALLERDRAAGSPPSMARGLALSAAGWMALEQDDIKGATALCQEGLAIARACGDTQLVAEHLSQLGHAARQQVNYLMAQAHYEESLALRQASNDRLGVAWSLRNLAHVARLRGEYERACALYEQSLAASSPPAPRSEVAGTLGYLGNALLRRGDLDEAYRRFAESLTICRDIGHRRRLAYALEGLAGVAAGRGAWERSLRLAGAATALRELIGAPLWPAGLAALEFRLGPARQQLGPARAAECWSAGRALPLDVAVAEALNETEADSAPATPAMDAPPSIQPMPTTQDALAPHPLTHREVDVARLIARGHTNRQIAEELVISEGTAAVHVKHILNKLGLESRTQVAAWAFRNGLAADTG